MAKTRLQSVQKDYSTTNTQVHEYSTHDLKYLPLLVRWPSLWTCTWDARVGKKNYVCMYLLAVLNMCDQFFLFIFTFVFSHLEVLKYFNRELLAVMLTTGELEAYLSKLPP